jgi:hypothetical protein
VKISAGLATLFSAIFALVCLGVALTGFMSLGEISDPVQLRDAKGFAWFWAFLGSVGLIFGGISWWIARTTPNDQ